jgi:hypothetical protein
MPLDFALNLHDTQLKGHLLPNYLIILILKISLSGSYIQIFQCASFRLINFAPPTFFTVVLPMP